MTIFSALLLFFMGCVLWILTQIAWKVIENKMIIRFQNQKIDAIYAKVFRLVLKSIKDFKDLKEYGGRCE